MSSTTTTRRSRPPRPTKIRVWIDGPPAPKLTPLEALLDVGALVPPLPLNPRPPKNWFRLNTIHLRATTNMKTSKMAPPASANGSQLVLVAALVVFF